MTETIKKCYCDVLSEHDGQKVSGASTYKDITVMVPDANGVLKLSKVTLDMCPDCYQKYHTNLKLTYDYMRRSIYNFITDENTSSNS